MNYRLRDVRFVHCGRFRQDRPAAASRLQRRADCPIISVSNADHSNPHQRIPPDNAPS